MNIKKRKNRLHKRETHRRMGFFFVLVVILETTFGTPSVTAVNAAQEPKLYAYSAVLYDGEAGRVLYEKNGYEILPMASTTKIMTLLLVLEHTEPTEVVTVSPYAAKQPDVQLNMNTGEQYYVKDLCYSLMLESHNDTAVALAEHVGGSVEGFAALMNAKAKALGAYSANFVTPNGLDAEGHGIAAADLAKIAAYAVKQEEFRTITTTPSHTFTELTKGRTFTVNNKDAFLTMMEGAIGVKTGFTGKAGYCFVGALEREDRLLISVVLASGWPPHKTYKWSDTKQLMNYGLENYQKLPLFEESLTLPSLRSLPVIKGQKDAVSLTISPQQEKELAEYRLLRTGEETIEFTPEIKTTVLTAPVSEGTKVGELVVTVDGECIKKIPIHTAETVVPVSFHYYFREITNQFFSGSTIKNLLP